MFSYKVVLATFQQPRIKDVWAYPRSATCSKIEVLPYNENNVISAHRLVETGLNS